MAEEDDNLLEDVPEVDKRPDDAEEDSEDSASKKNKLLIIVAAGIFLLLIILIIVYFFVLSSDEPASSQEVATELSEEADLFDDPNAPTDDSVDENTEADAISEVDEDTEAREQPSNSSAKLSAISGSLFANEDDEKATPDEDDADETVEGKGNGEEKVEPSETDLLKQQIDALQKQFEAMNKTNKDLSQNLDDLYKENNMLRATVGLTGAEAPDEETTEGNPFVNPGYGSYGYEGDPYKYTPKYEIDPKWGEFSENLPSKEELNPAKKK